MQTFYSRMMNSGVFFPVGKSTMNRIFYSYIVELERRRSYLPHAHMHTYTIRIAGCGCECGDRGPLFLVASLGSVYLDSVRRIRPRADGWETGYTFNQGTESQRRNRSETYAPPQNETPSLFCFFFSFSRCHPDQVIDYLAWHVITGLLWRPLEQRHEQKLVFSGCVWSMIGCVLLSSDSVQRRRTNKLNDIKTYHCTVV